MGPPTVAARVQGGSDAAIWRVEVAGRTYALRVLGPAQAGQAEREASTMRAAFSGGVPVPTIAAAGRWCGSPVLVMTWTEGQTLAEALLADPTDRRRAEALGAEVGRVQAAIHALPVAVPHTASWESWGGADATLQAHLAALVDRRPGAILHLDLHPRNVLVEGDRVTAVLDWANALVGDPRADVARTLSLLRLAPLPEGADRDAVRLALHAFEAGWLAAYQEEAGPVGDLAPFCWWAGRAMERELEPRLGRPELPWLTSMHMTRVRRWTAGHRNRATRAPAVGKIATDTAQIGSHSRTRHGDDTAG